MSLYRRIVHATDFSRASRPALALAVDLAKRHGAELMLLHVLVPPSPFVGSEVAAMTFEDLEARARSAAERRLSALVGLARKRGARAKGRVVEGVPAEVITRLARRSRADLIVIGTHGRTGLSRIFLGSVARRVLELAACPVLSVHGPR